MKTEDFDMRIVVIATLALCAILAGCKGDEVESCNSDQVKATILNASFNTPRNDAIKSLEEKLKSQQSEGFKPYPIGPFGRIPSPGSDDEKYEKGQFQAEHERTGRNLAALRKMSATIENIRQRKYDGANNTRYCSAEFAYKNFDDDAWLAVDPTKLAQHPACRDSVEYKIEKMVDKPGAFYVSWQCLP